MTSIDGVMSNAWRVTKAMPGFIFGTEADLMGETLRKSYKNQGFKGFKTQIGDAFIKGMEDHEAAVSANKGFFKNMWKDITSIFPEIKDNWQQVGKVADAANKTGWSKFWPQLKSVGKAFGKRMPLIGAIAILATELPNIIKASWNEGLLAGAGETAKTGVRLGLGAVGGAIGAAVIPIPLLGSVVGYAVGDMIGKFIVGKSYSEKQVESGANNNQKSANNFQFDPNSIPGCGNLMSDEEFQKLQQSYMQMANPGANNFMMPQMGQLPQGGFNTVG